MTQSTPSQNSPSRFSPKRLLPKSLAGQLITLLLLALVGAQIFSLMILHDERRLAFRFVAQQEVLSRTASVIRLLNQSPANLHETIVKTASTRRLQFELSGDSAVGDEEEDEGVNHFMQKRMANWLDGEVADIRIAVYDDHDNDDDDHDEEEKDDDDDDEYKTRQKFEELRNRGADRNRWWGGWRRHDHDRRDFSRFERRNWGPKKHFFIGLTISAKTLGGPWLNVFTLVPPANPEFALPSLASMAVMAVALIIIVTFMVRRVTRPLASLSDAAERFGRGENVEPLREKGPEDIRKATRTFNTMQERLHRFVRDRTQMMAAVSHDLRTPITSLRLRAEMIEDEETRTKIIAALDEMQTLAEATLAFAREEATAENTRIVDLGALIDAVGQDLADLGNDVSFDYEETAPEDKITVAARPVALKRAFRNLIENAVKYGGRAIIELEKKAEEIAIHVDDEGPGIDPDMRQRIFEPFVRLEESRSRDTGGIGLGLAIARSIIRGHGGDIEVSDNEKGGARFTVRLPLTE